jgi:hypothetical protein
MAFVRYRYDRDLDCIVVEPVGGTITHLDASGTDGDVDIYQHADGRHALTGGDGFKKVASAKVVRGVDTPNPAVTGNDLTGKPREDTPVPGQSDKADAVHTGVSAPILEKAASGQSATDPEVQTDLAKTAKETETK